MRRRALALLLIALIVGLLGFWGFPRLSSFIAKLLFPLFLVAFSASLTMQVLEVQLHPAPKRHEEKHGGLTEHLRHMILRGKSLAGRVRMKTRQTTEAASQLVGPREERTPHAFRGSKGVRG